MTPLFFSVGPCSVRLGSEGDVPRLPSPSLGGNAGADGHGTEEDVAERNARHGGRRALPSAGLREGADVWCKVRERSRP